jgi:predicted transcriptional regulator of viral defense system
MIADGIFKRKVNRGFWVIHILRQKIPHEEFDYQMLLDALKAYARPRDKITGLLKKGMIIRVKKGLYIFGETYRKKPYSKEILANLVFGPSYISLDYALQHYGLIPERVEAVTSITTGRSKNFSTPVGLFTYRSVPLNAFRIGMDRVEMDEARAFLIATPEKALADKIQSDRGAGNQTQKALTAYLENDLRIDMTKIAGLDPKSLDDMACRYRSRKIARLSNLVRRSRRHVRKEKSHA